MTPLPPDPVIDEIREIRRRISAQFDHDPKRLLEYYIEFQRQFGDRLVSPPTTPPVAIPEFGFFSAPDLSAAADDESAVG